MILPCPESLREYKRFPLTITLVLLNVLIFLTLFSGSSSRKIFSAQILRQDGLITTGRVYYQYLQALPLEELSAKPTWVRKMVSGNSEQMGILGAYALRDALFLEHADTFAARGDQVQIATWRISLGQFREQYKEQILYRFGLSSLEKKPLSWVTYQFSHSNWMHMLSNLAFLVVVGAAVEALAGSGVLILLYIFGGIAGGLGFLWLDPHGTVPMVGASAAISALLAFYCLAEERRRIQYYYFVSPMPQHYGPIYLPTLIIIPLFLLADLASLWSTPEGIGSGVAYAAHLGGAAVGAFAGVCYRCKIYLPN